MSLPTVVSCTQLGSSRGSVGAYANSNWARKAWLVVLSGADPDGWLVATQADGVIQPSSVDDQTHLTCVSVTAEPVSGDEECVNYIVSADLRDDPAASTPKGGSSSALLPWDRCDRVERSTKQYAVPMEQDFTQDDLGNLTPKPLVNTAGEKLPGVMHELINPFLRIHRSRKVSTFDYVAAQRCQGTINDADFTVYPITAPSGIVIPAGEAVLHSVVANDQIWRDPASPLTGVAYYEVVFEVECKGQYPPGNINLGDYLAANVGVTHLGIANDLSTKVHAANRVLDPIWSGTGTPQYRKSGGQYVQVPVAHPVYLELDGTRATDLSDDHLQTLVKKFKRFPKVNWADWVV